MAENLTKNWQSDQILPANLQLHTSQGPPQTDPFINGCEFKIILQVLKFRPA